MFWPLRCESAHRNWLATFDENQALLAEQVAIFGAIRAMLHEIAELRSLSRALMPKWR